MARNFESFSSTASGINTAPDLLVTEVAFINKNGLAVPADSDLRVEIFNQGDNVPTVIGTLSSNPPIIPIVRDTGVYFIFKFNPQDYPTLDSNKPVIARWYGKVNGVEWSPFPIEQVYDLNKGKENILISEELKQWILTEMGFPVTGVETTDVQVNQAISNALRHYNQWIPKYKFGTIRLIAGVTRYEIPESGKGVIRVDFLRREGLPLISDPLFGREYPRGAQLDFAQYSLGITFFKTLLRVTSQEPEWYWTPTDPLAIWINAQNQSYRVMYTFAVDHRLEEITPEHNQLFRELCLAYFKRILGHTRRKYAIPTQGGGSIELDGKILSDEAKESLTKLNDTLKTMIPPIFTMPPVQ